MANHAAVIARIKFMDEQFQQLTGREAFGYVSNPTPTTPRLTFHDGTVCLTYEEAHQHMYDLLDKAQNDPGSLPYPFDQELTPEQDLRLIRRTGA